MRHGFLCMWYFLHCRLSLRLETLSWCFLSGLIYWYSVFPGYFPSLGFPSKGSPVSLNSDTSLAPNFIGKCGSVCAVPLLLWGRGGSLNHLLCHIPVQQGFCLKGVGTQLFRQGRWGASYAVCQQRSRNTNTIWRNSCSVNPLYLQIRR